MTQSIIIIGISGPSASGKSLLANTIVKELGSDQVVVISEDAYYKDSSHLSFAEREKLITITLIHLIMICFVSTLSNYKKGFP